jgi:hypothetical protein
MSAYRKTAIEAFVHAFESRGAERVNTLTVAVDAIIDAAATNVAVTTSTIASPEAALEALTKAKAERDMWRDRFDKVVAELDIAKGRVDELREAHAKELDKIRELINPVSILLEEEPPPSSR